MNICCKAVSLSGEAKVNMNTNTSKAQDMTLNNENNASDVRQLGAWGDYYACGTPWKLIRNLLCEHLPAVHKVK